MTTILQLGVSDQVSILVGQTEMWSDVSFFNYYFYRGSLFEIIISYHYLLIIWLKNLSGRNVRPKLRFRRTWADFSRALSDDRQLFAALDYIMRNIFFVIVPCVVMDSENTTLVNFGQHLFAFA